MDVLIVNFKWVMLVGGLATLSMMSAVLAPRAALKATFGETLEGPVAEIVVRNWGLLICLSALFVIWAAFEPVYRIPALAIAVIGKLSFCALVLAQRAVRRKAMAVVIADLALSALYGAYLVMAR